MGRRGIVWKTPDITADGLKMFACIVMLIQSIGIVVVEKGLIHLDQYTQAGLNEPTDCRVYGNQQLPGALDGFCLCKDDFKCGNFFQIYGGDRFV